MNELKKIDTRESVKTVTSNNFITAKGLEKLSLKARKMLYIAISQCRKNDKNFYTYQISIKEFANLMNITPEAVYQEADKITDELMTGILCVVPEKNKYFKKYSIFSMCEYDHDGILRFKLNQDMSDFLLQLKGNFSQPLLNDFMKMKSPYSMAVWHLMQREMHSNKPNLTNTIQFDLSLKELRDVTGTQEKLKQLGEFKNRVFDKALREIDENCCVKVTYENIKKGRRVIGFHCSVVSIFHIDEDKISQKVKDKARLGKLRIESKNRELTLEEQKEYEILNKNVTQMEFFTHENDY